MNKLKKNPSELSRIVKNHLVLGLVRSRDLADDLVGPSAAGTKLRSNVYQSEDRDWKDVKVSKLDLHRDNKLLLLLAARSSQ